MDIVAPGRDILSIRGQGTDMFADVGEPDLRILDSLYYLSDGTSMATPMVAAAAAFLLSVRPELSLADVEAALSAGTRDMIQPFDTGAAFPGPDSLSGAGTVDIARSLEIIDGTGLAFAAPANYSRQIGAFAVKALPVEGYSSSWTLEIGVGALPDTFALLSSAASLPADSTLLVYDNTLSAGLLTFCLTDAAGHASYLRVFVPAVSVAQLSFPRENDTVFNLLAILGSAYAADYDSLTIWDMPAAGPPRRIFSSTAEFYRDTVFIWQISEVTPGVHSLILNAHTRSAILADSVTVTVKSLLHSGWPRSVPGFAGISPVAADLDFDGDKEIMIGSSAGLFVFDSEGQTLPGFPVSSSLDCRSIPTTYDVDRDGSPDILYTSDSGLHIVNRFGADLAGFPQLTTTGQVFLGFPTPRVMKLALEEDSAIVFINAIGQLRAYRFNGDPYFYSLGGLFSRIDPNIRNNFVFRGLSIPHVTNFDRNRDGRAELISAYSSPGATSGVFVFNGRDGQAANERVSARVLEVQDSHGVAYGDIDGDGTIEALLSGTSVNDVASLWLRRRGEEDLPGWPVELPEVTEWIGGYPVLADLDGDDVPEIIAIFSEFDISRIYAFRIDGSPFFDIPGRFTGEIRTIDVILGSPVIADVTGDGVPEIIARSGLLFPGSGFERLHAFTPEGADVPGFPITTAADPISVTSLSFIPLIDDVDGDGLAE
ncbi:MAG: S8 family serine peptidase, partial [Candidatus Zixiibacteriota bacterium]